MPAVPKTILALLLAFCSYISIRFIYVAISHYLTGLKKLSKSSILISLAICLRVFFSIAESPIPNAIPFSNALIVFTSIFLFIQFLDLFFIDFLLVKYRSLTIPPLLHSIILWVLYTIVALFLFSTYLNLNITPLLATSAVFSMVIGLALQDLLMNLFAGIALNLEKPFEVNDWVMINKNEGQIVEITWRTTKIRTRGNDYVIIPNATVSKQEILNFARPSNLHERKVDIGINYLTPPNKVKEVLLEAIGKTKGILKNPPPLITLTKFQDFSINYKMRFWINDYFEVVNIENELNTYIWYLLKRNNIEIPFPIRTTQLYPMPSILREREERLKKEIITFLKNVDILNPLSEIELMELAKNLNYKRFASGEILFSENDTGDTFYFIKSGNVEVSKLNKYGCPSVIASLGPGNYFGEMSLLTGEKRTATVNVVKDVEAIIINRDTFKRILVNNPSIAEALSKVLDKRYREMQEELSRAKDISVTNGKISASTSSRFLKSIKGLFGLS